MTTMTWNVKDLPKPWQPTAAGVPTVMLAAQLSALDDGSARRLPPDVQRELLAVGLIDDYTWRQHRRLLCRGIIAE